MIKNISTIEGFLIQIKSLLPFVFDPSGHLSVIVLRYYKGCKDILGQNRQICTYHFHLQSLFLCEWGIFSHYFVFYLCHLNFLIDIVIFGRQICLDILSVAQYLTLWIHHNLKIGYCGHLGYFNLCAKQTLLKILASSGTSRITHLQAKKDWHSNPFVFTRCAGVVRGQLSDHKP